MLSTDLRKAPGLLTLELDQRDWFSEFREESAFPEVSPQRAETLFAVVRHGRSAPISLPDTPETPDLVDYGPMSSHRRRSLFGRVKRALSPALTALFVVYVLVIFMTAWIGIRGSDSMREADLTIQGSAPETADSGGPANRP